MYPSFFGKYTSSFQVAENQSTDLEKNDLQIGVGTADNTGSSVEFSSMVHSMGLVNLTLGSKTVPSTRVFKPGSTSEILFDRAPTTSITATSNFTASVASNSASLRNKSTGIYLLVGKPSTTVTFTGNSSEKYTWNATYTFSKNTGNIKTATPSREYDNAGWGFDYTGAVQTFTAPVTGTYKLECWGASGSDDPYGKGAIPGNGGYVAGCITFSSNTSLYIYVGGKGTSLYNHDAMTNAGGWNGGGFATANNPNAVGGGGGGSTDIRIIKHSDSNGWSGTASLRSRIIVGGGGGGCCGIGTTANGGNAGGLAGDATPMNSLYSGDINIGTGGTQTSGGVAAEAPTKENSDYMNKISRGVVDPYGHFGYASQVKPSEYTWWSGGAGGGWYGGSNGHGTGGSGGSSFISGMTGCVAITADGKQTSGVSTMTINGKAYSFTSPVMKGGGESMPKHDGTSGTMTGNYGNGYAIITQLSY